MMLTTDFSATVCYPCTISKGTQHALENILVHVVSVKQQVSLSVSFYKEFVPARP